MRSTLLCALLLLISGCFIPQVFGFGITAIKANNRLLVRNAHTKVTPNRCQQIHKGNRNGLAHRQSSPAATTCCNLLPEIVASSLSAPSEPIQQSTFLIAETEEWRQYVLLFVSLGVILDVLLGNPLANLALAPMRRAAMEKDGSQENTQDGDNTSSASSPKKFVANPRERVDSEAVGMAALQKARYSMELRRYLEENKTDEQKYEEMRRKIDQEAAKFDSKMEE